MADLSNGMVSVLKRKGFAVVGTLAMTASLTGFATLSAGAAYADDLSADPATVVAPSGVGDDPSTRVRVSGSTAYAAIQGKVTSSVKAVPVSSYSGQVIAGSPQPGNLSAGLDECLFAWAGC